MDREKGIKAIIYLQSMAGIRESRDKAERGWDGMSEHEQETTIHVYEMLKGGEN